MATNPLTMFGIDTGVEPEEDELRPGLPAPVKASPDVAKGQDVDLSPMLRGLVQSWTDDAMRSSADPSDVLKQKISKKDMALDILGGFLAGMANKPFQTTRQRLVKQELLRQESEQKRLALQTSRIQSIATLAGVIERNRPTPNEALEKFRSGMALAQENLNQGLWSQDEYDKFQERMTNHIFAGGEAPNPDLRSNLDKEYGDYLNKDEKRKFALAEFAVKEKEAAKKEDRVPRNLDAFTLAVEAREEELGRDLTEPEVYQVAARLKTAQTVIREDKAGGHKLFNTGNELEAVAQQAYLALAPNMPEARAEALAASLKQFAQAGNETVLAERLRWQAIQAQPNAAMRERAVMDLQSMEALQDIQELMINNPGLTGKLKGLMEHANNRFLGRTTNPNLALADQALVEALIKYRKAHTGVAFNVIEAQQYSQILPTIEQNPELALTLISGRLAASMREHENMLKLTLGTQVYQRLYTRSNVRVEE